MTIYIPEVGETTIPEVVKSKVVKGVLNHPVEGTPIRATLGQTVIVGKVAQRETRHALIDILINGQGGFYGETHACWIASGWTFEILGDAPETVTA